jgi:pyruvyl transferase EpsO
MARDRRSLATLAALPPHVRTYLHIDSAFALAPVVDEIVASLGDARPKGVVRLRRRDGERAAGAEDLAGAIDWQAPDDLAELAAKAPPPRAFRQARKLFTSPNDMKSFARLWAAVKVFHGAARIETDRLHAHILAVMLGKKHKLIRDRYGKIEDFVTLWTGETGLAEVVRERGQRDSGRAGARVPA